MGRASSSAATRRTATERTRAGKKGNKGRAAIVPRAEWTSRVLVRSPVTLHTHLLTIKVPSLPQPRPPAPTVSCSPLALLPHLSSQQWPTLVPKTSASLPWKCTSLVASVLFFPPFRLISNHVSRDPHRTLPPNSASLKRPSSSSMVFPLGNTPLAWARNTWSSLTTERTSTPSRLTVRLLSSPRSEEHRPGYSICE
jgi:hypothetical protein